MASSASTSTYKVTWFTDRLAVGCAPMSYEDLDYIREQGISAIVNLCGEYCDLHRIERDSGFEVCYLPVPDDGAPKVEELDRALHWLDEAMILGKKVLIHCRFGIGRTTTFLTAYFLRRGFDPKTAEKTVRRLYACPTSFSQWRLLRKYGKRAGKLTMREPSLERTNGQEDALCRYFAEYEALRGLVAGALEQAAARSAASPSCGKDTDACCGRFLHLQFIEAMYLRHHVDKTLTREARLAAIDRAILAEKAASGGVSPAPARGPHAPCADIDAGAEGHPGPAGCAGPEAGSSPDPGLPGYRCPLSDGGKCAAYGFRPLACMLHDLHASASPRDIGPAGSEDDGGDANFPGRAADPAETLSALHINDMLCKVSSRLFHALNGARLQGKSLLFPITRVVSGKYVQDYFALLSRSTD